MHFRAGGWQEDRHTSSSSFFLMTCSAKLGLRCSAQATSRQKISGTVPAANGTALWERYPTRGFFSQARKEGSNIARNFRPDAESGQVFRSTGSEVHSVVRKGTTVFRRKAIQRKTEMQRLAVAQRDAPLGTAALGCPVERSSMGFRRSPWTCRTLPLERKVEALTQLGLSPRPQKSFRNSRRKIFPDAVFGTESKKRTSRGCL